MTRLEQVRLAVTILNNCNSKPETVEETIALVENPEECLVLGLSCSGNSSNVVKSLHWAEDKNFNTFMISGQKSLVLREGIDELIFNCEYFHTVEVMCMIVLYDLIHKVGSHCPSITEEKKRMADSSLRKLED